VRPGPAGCGPGDAAGRDAVFSPAARPSRHNRRRAATAVAGAALGSHAMHALRLRRISQHGHAACAAPAVVSSLGALAGRPRDCARLP
jgi:hypothetical protein